MKRYNFLVIIFSLLFVPVFGDAETLQSMYNQLSELQRQQANVNNGKALTNNQIASLKSEINTINNKISQTENEIKESENSIIESEKKIEQKKEETNQMLMYLQITNDENMYLQYIFEAESYTDFIYRYSVVTQMSDYNSNLINELNNLISELEEKKKQLSVKQGELSSQKQELGTKLTTLNANLKELTTEGTSIQDDINSLKKDISKYEKMGCSKSEQISSCIIRNQKSSGIVSATGWNLPVSGARVTSQFTLGYRTDCIGCGSDVHRGIDLGVGEGTPVYAAANGTVAYVVTSGSSLSCGGIKVYIYHVVNGGLYTTTYMHLLSANVSVGAQVTPNTIIGYSGGGSTASRNGGYDRCTTGAHLHFGVATGNSVANFNSNVFNPRQLSILANGADGVYVSR